MKNLAKNPFSSPQFLKHSNLFRAERNEIIPFNDISLTPNTGEIHSKLVSFINNGHPCLGAQSVFNKKNYYFGIYDSLGSNNSTFGLSRDLMQFIIDYPPVENTLYSFIAIFQDRRYSEVEFEKNLWKQLGKLHGEDKIFHKWDDSVSKNSADPNFSFSFAEKAFYIIGMHPDSSRKARRFEYPMLIFNYHEQFERLRANGIYNKMKNSIRKRDTEYSGSVNPMLEDFGEASEAKQYSGRIVDNKWKCPFHKD